MIATVMSDGTVPVWLGPKRERTAIDIGPQVGTGDSRHLYRRIPGPARQRLAMLDHDGNGVLRNQELQGIAIWQDANGNGRCEAGEVNRVEQHGIVALSVRYQRDDAHLDRIAWSPGGVTLQDGPQRATYDILLQPR